MKESDVSHPIVFAALECHCGPLEDKCTINYGPEGEGTPISTPYNIHSYCTESGGGEGNEAVE